MLRKEWGWLERCSHYNLYLSWAIFLKPMMGINPSIRGILHLKTVEPNLLFHYDMEGRVSI